MLLIGGIYKWNQTQAQHTHTQKKTAQSIKDKWPWMSWAFGRTCRMKEKYSVAQTKCNQTHTPRARWKSMYEFYPNKYSIAHHHYRAIIIIGVISTHQYDGDNIYTTINFFLNFISFAVAVNIVLLLLLLLFIFHTHVWGECRAKS